MPDSPDAPQGAVPLDIPVIRVPGTLSGIPTPGTVTPTMMEPGRLQPVAAERLIDHGGMQGLFTPLVPQDAAASQEGTENLRAIVRMLRDQVAQLQQENARLRRQMEEARARASRMPDDFASAVSHSIDTLQGRLTHLSNPVTDFAVREFSIDARVQIDVTPLGTVQYRFIQPGESVDPAHVSNISMTVVPIPKQSSAGSFSRAEFTPTLGIEQIVGIGEQHRRKLNEQQIYTVSDLLHAGTRVRSSVELASLLEVDRHVLSGWLGQAQLLTVREIDGRMASVLYSLGITDLDRLSAADAAKLAADYSRAAGAQGLPAATPAQVEGWIASATAFVGRRGTPEPVPAPTPVPAPAPYRPTTAYRPAYHPYGYGSGFTGIGARLI